MGKSSTAKKKRKGLTAQEKIVRKEVNRLDAKRNAMWHDHMDSALEQYDKSRIVTAEADKDEI